MAKDIIHEPVKRAIKNAGWTITNDQYTVQFAEFTMYADLAAERVIAAQRGKDKIAVEIKSFVKRSPVQDVRDALGQYVMYRAYLAQVEPDRKLYMATSMRAYRDVFGLKAVEFLMEQFAIALIVVNIEREEVIRWID
ncbi:MAG: element excision factor XisH family protein [Caldilineaceae bacterium]